MPTCSKCGEDKKSQGFATHEVHCKGGGVAVMEQSTNARPEAQSRRGRMRFSDPAPSALEQVPRLPQGVFGAWAYYLRPTGATIAEALVLSPNGGVPDSPDPKIRAKYGTNAEYYRSRQAANGLKYLGTKLTTEAMRELVAVMERSRGEEILYMKDVIADMDYRMSNGIDPRWHETFEKRKAKAQKRLEMLTADWDPDALVRELDEISRAQRLAAIDPNVLGVMREMVGEVNERMVSYFQSGATSGTQIEGVKNVQRSGSPENGDVFA